MRVCVVGSGGREAALAACLSRTASVVVTPGNPGIAGSVPDKPEDITADLYVIGPEVPLVDGLADRLRAQGQVVFGPGADGARLEGSKAFMKDLAAAAEVPTADYATFDVEADALDYLAAQRPPYVVKTDGLAAGKGVLVTDDLDTAVADVRAKLRGESFGGAGRRVVIEEGMTGPELSVLGVCDGQRAVMLAPARDYKRVGVDDTGPNTGGMGAFSPVPDIDEALLERIQHEFFDRTLAELNRRGVDYRGVLYAGLMLTDAGPRLVEYNIRFGDPEAQVVLPRLTSDLAELLFEAATGRIRTEPTFTDEACVTVALAAEGYPAQVRTGDEIAGLDDAADIDGVELFTAGVAEGTDGLVTAGGRVLYVTARGRDLDEARTRAYEAAEVVEWPGRFYRSDIAR